MHWLLMGIHIHIYILTKFNKVEKGLLTVICFISYIKTHEKESSQRNSYVSCNVIPTNKRKYNCSKIYI